MSDSIAQTSSPNMDRHPIFQEAWLPIDALSKVHGTSYVLDILGRLNLPIVPICMARRGMAAACAALRHDVDYHLANALAMAQIEHSLGIASTYYMLPPDGVTCMRNYFGEIADGHLHISRLFLDTAKHMQDMGHEIGIHNDFISFWIGTGISPKDAIAAILDRMSAAGLHVRGMAAHGSRLCREHGYVNSEIFEGEKGWCQADTLDVGGRKLALRTLTCGEFGLEYAEAYVHESLYASDSGNNLCLAFQGREMPLDGESLARNVILEHIGKIPDFSSIQLLIHPDHWTFQYAMGDGNIEPCLNDIIMKMQDVRMKARECYLKNETMSSISPLT